jgi:hypothetical protein
MVSLRPLWSLATDCRAASGRRVRALAIHEPDSLTVLNDSTQGLVGASWSSDGDVAKGRMVSEKWLADRSLEAVPLTHLGFGAKSAERPSGVPTVFREYWTLL